MNETGNSVHFPQLDPAAYGDARSFNSTDKKETLSFSFFKNGIIKVFSAAEMIQ
jgi:hypothetical protein